MVSSGVCEPRIGTNGSALEGGCPFPTGQSQTTFDSASLSFERNGESRQWTCPSSSSSTSTSTSKTASLYAMGNGNKLLQSSMSFKQARTTELVHPRLRKGNVIDLLSSSSSSSSSHSSSSSSSSSSSPSLDKDTCKAIAYDLRGTSFPFLMGTTPETTGASFGNGMSGQLLNLSARATRPLVWNTNANAVLFVIEGSIDVNIYGGVTAGSESSVFEITVGEKGIVYIPINAAYDIKEASGNTHALVTLVFDHPKCTYIS